MENQARWKVAVVSVVIQICLGSIYAWSVFLEPLMREFGWSKIETSLTFTFVLVAYALAMNFGGRWQDKIGPRQVATRGGVLLALGYVLASHVNSLWGLYITYGILSGIGVGIGYSCPISVCLKWFPDKKGFITGLAVAGFGSGALIFAPVAAKIIAIWGWRQAFLVLGVVFFFATIIGARFLKNPPSGWRPQGFREINRKQGPVDLTWHKTIKTYQFWLLWLMFCFSASSGLMVIGHLSALLGERGLSVATAALAVGILSASNGISRIGWGMLSDRIGSPKSLKLILTVLSLVMFIFPYMSSKVGLLLLSGVVGLGFGGILALFPTLSAEYFGLKNVGANYGLLFTAYGLAGVVGPGLAAKIYVATGGYNLAFVILGALCLVALGISIFIKPPQPGGHSRVGGTKW